jgi:hypothetical protein
MEKVTGIAAKCLLLSIDEGFQLGLVSTFLFYKSSIGTVLFVCQYDE